MGLFDKAVAGSLGFIPRPLVRRVASQYIAGETPQDALTEIRRLNEQGCMATLDLLGEYVREPAEARASADVYLDLLDGIDREGLDANISIKPTQFGLTIDRQLFADNARRVVQRARDLGNFVRIDMESAATTDDTLEVYRHLRSEGLDNVGVVLQARLRRTLDDIRALEPLRPSIRLCKGVYLEPEDIALQSYQDINAAYLEQLSYLLARPDFYVGIATHDDPLIEGAERLIAEHGLERDQYELQVLLGVRPEVRRRLVDAGHRVRVYVPFGDSWYAYCVRRLKENPQFAGHVTRDLLKDPTRLFGASEGR